MRRVIGRRNGFTLVEALAAFAILGVVMSGLLNGVSGAARNGDRAEFLMRASRLGRSHLETLGVSSPLVPGSASGAYEDGLLWTLQVEPFRHGESGAPSNAAAYWVRLTVRRARPLSRAPETFDLTTLKIVTRQESGP